MPAKEKTFDQIPDDAKIVLEKKDFIVLINECRSSVDDNFRLGDDEVSSAVETDIEEMFMDNYVQNPGLPFDVETIAINKAARNWSDSEILDAILDAAGPGVRTAVRALQGG